MQLESMWVHGMRRFGGEKPTRLRLDSPLVCLIGSNEVGKSTLLDALELGHGRDKDDDGRWVAVARSELTRSETIENGRRMVLLRYRLSEDEVKMLGDLPAADRLRGTRWLEIEKFADGRHFTKVNPVPTRDKTTRYALAERFKKELEDSEGIHVGRAEDSPAASATITSFAEALATNQMYIRQVLPGLRALAALLEGEERDPKLVAQIQAVVESEDEDHPLDQAREVLEPLVPQFVRFELVDRELADEYDLATQAARPPTSLRNLAELADLDLDQLLEEVQADITGNVDDLIKAANLELERRFDAWTQQPPVRVSLAIWGTRLLVHVQSGQGPTMKIRERSDGLRQFVALVALTAGEGHSVPPILLIDEAERHLHYDAQADLIGVLEEQTAASQVIYTTHSAACLPEDLGAGVRVVHGVEEQMLSTVEQQFWSDDAGLVTLLLAMGAGSLAFVPLRPAVIVEGGSDLVLLPSLLKEATGEEMLGFQIVPGAANVPPQRVAGLDLQGVNSAWVLDGDGGGKERRAFLIRNKVPADHIHLLKVGNQGLDLEDLIHAETYVAAVNNYLTDVGGSAKFTRQSLPKDACRRHKAVEKWCVKKELQPPGKTAIANKVLEFRGHSPLAEPHRRATLRALYRALQTHFVGRQDG